MVRRGLDGDLERESSERGVREYESERSRPLDSDRAGMLRW